MGKKNWTSCEVIHRTTVKLSGPTVIRLKRAQVYLCGKMQTPGLPTISDVFDFLLRVFDNMHATANEDIGNDLALKFESEKLVKDGIWLTSKCKICGCKSMKVLDISADGRTTRQCNECSSITEVGAKLLTEKDLEE